MTAGDLTPRAWQSKAAQAFRAGDLAAAADALGKAVELDPGEPDYLRNLAELARESGDREGARSWLERAAVVTGQSPSVARLNLLAAGWYDLGDRERMLQAAISALELDDTDTTSRGLIADALSKLPGAAAQNRGLLARAIAEGWSDPERLSAVAYAILREDWPSTPEGLASDPLLRPLLASGAIRDEILEARLTELRRSLLLERPPAAVWPLLSDLALQCFINEYAWAVTTEEQLAVEALRSGKRTACDLLALAMYTPLGGLPDAEALLAEPSSLLRPVIRQQIEEPREEQALAATIPALTPIVGEVSKQVRQMYEENPYPRWVRNGPGAALPLPVALRRIFTRTALAPIPNGDGPDILVAGCGTGRHPLLTAQFTGSRVLAVDLSVASLSYAKRKAREFGVENIQFAHADVLELSGRSFDSVEASGSLQCMDDPDEAVRRLCGMLRPGGVFGFGLYSAAAREGLRAARALGDAYPRTPDGIREFRKAILTAPQGDPVRGALAFPDFFTTSMCRDLLLHVKEHVHRISDIQRMLAANDLRLLGFILSPEVMAQYRQRFPADPSATNLDNWDAFEADHPRTFAGMYQFWAQKADGG